MTNPQIYKQRDAKKPPQNEEAFVHDAVNLSNSFMEDLEKVGKFYEKHKEYIRSNYKMTLEEV